MGIPLPIALPKVEISGVILKIFCAPPKDTLKPVQISSKIKTVLCFVHKYLNFFKNFNSGISLEIGSMIIAANLFSLNLF